MRCRIVLEPYGGLANRMRALNSGIWLSGVLQRDLDVIWNVDATLNCPFDELFEPLAHVTIVKPRPLLHHLRPTGRVGVSRRLLRTLLSAPLTLRYRCLEDADVRRLETGVSDGSEFAESGRTLYFRTCEVFGAGDRGFARFVPTRELRRKIDARCVSFTTNTIGVHIRRTDNSVSINQSPTGLFVERIEDELARNADVNVFLSTDDANVEELLKSLFGDKILAFEKEYSRDSSDGIKDAVVDMYCLANTSRIYGSYWSSFTDVAAEINGIRLEKPRIGVAPEPR